MKAALLADPRQQRHAVRRFLLVAGLGLALGCRERQAEPGEAEGASADGKPRVLLAGAFRAVSKTTTGRAEIVQVGERFQLRLSGMKTQADEHTRVFLVGLPDARTSRAVDEAEMKYDLAALEPPEQTIELPGRPDPALRCVVLWNRAYAVNLAAAPLHAP